MLRKKVVSILLMVSMMLSLCTTVFVAAEGDTINATHTTYVRFGTRGSNSYAGQTSIQLLSKADVKNRYVPFMRFESSDVQAVADAGMITLNLTVSSMAQHTRLLFYGLVDNEAISQKTGWVEDAESSSNMTGDLATTLGLTGDTDTLNAGTYSYEYDNIYAVGNTLEIDVTDYLKSQTDGIYSFMIYAKDAIAVNKTTRFYSKLADVGAELKPYLKLYSEDSDIYKAKFDANNVDLSAYNAGIKNELVLPSAGVNGSALTWTSSDESVLLINEDGTVTVTRPINADAQVTLTVTATSGTITATAPYSVKVLMFNPNKMTPMGDTRIRYGSSVKATDYSAESTVRITGGSALAQRSHGWYRFENLDAANLTAVQNATYVGLRLKVESIDDAGDHFRVQGLNVLKTGWTIPDGIPPIDERVVLTGESASELGIRDFESNQLDILNTNTFTAGSYIELNVTDYVKEQTDGVYVFRTMRDTQNQKSIDFYSLNCGDPESYPHLQVYYGDEGTAKYVAKALTKEVITNSNYVLPSQMNGAEISWVANDPSDMSAVLGDDGYKVTITRGEQNHTATFTGTITAGEVTETAILSITIEASSLPHNKTLFKMGDSTIDTLSDGTLDISFKDGFAPENGTMFCATYDASGLIKTVTMSLNEGSGYSEALTIDSSISKVKVFLWSSDTLEPLMIEGELVRAQ